MQRILLLLLITVFQVQGYSQVNEARLDSIVKAYTVNNRFNGTVLVARDGKILLEKGYGYQDVAKKIPASPSSLYQYGSVTKQFTAALVLHLEEQGKLKLDDKLSKYFPQLPYADSVTIYNLLTHTSGIYNYTRNPDFMKSEAVKPIDQQKMFALFKDKQLDFQPGSKYSYSNSGYVLLGYIIEKASGKKYETLLTEKILKPLGMQTAGFDYTKSNSANRSIGYNSIDGEKVQPAGIVDSSVSFSAGSLYGTARDLYKWHLGLQEKKLLSGTSYAKFTKPFHSRYALGVSIDTSYGKHVEEHGGGIFGFTSMLKRFPADDVVIVVLSNNSSNATGDIAKNLSAVLFNQEVNLPKVRNRLPIPKATMESLVGEYELMPQFKLVISIEDDKLMVTPTGQGKTELYADTEDLYYVTVVDAELVFEKDSEGKVKGLILKQSGRELPGKKVK